MFAMMWGAWPRVTAEGEPIEVVAPDRMEAAVERAVGDLVAAQEEAGIGLVRDGDLRWADPGSAVLGAIATGDTGADGLLVRAWRATAAHTALPVAQSVSGPWSLAIRDMRGRVGSRDAAAALTGCALELAAALGADLGALADAGCPVVVVEEPAAVTLGEDPALRAGFVEAHRRLLADATSIHAMLAITGGSAHAAGVETIFGAPYASHLFDLIAGPDNWYLIRAAPGERGIVCAALVARGGTRGAGSDRAPLLSWAAHYAASSNGRGPDRVGLANASPLRDLEPADARAALVELGRAATLAAMRPAQAVEAGMDPRAVFAKPGPTRR